MSGLAQRLRKLEQIQSVGESDLANLTDEELLLSLRKSVELVGINWEAFKNDPEGEIRNAFERSRSILSRFTGSPNDDELEAQVLDTLRRLNFDWP